MRLLILSDLHLEQWGPNPLKLDLELSKPDIVILAGDIHSGAKAVPWAAQTFIDTPVLYVHGNHELYGGKYENTQRDIEEACQMTDNVHFLNCKECCVGDTRFLCCTLWTDFNLFGNDRRQASMRVAQDGMNDYHRIRLESNGYKKMRPTDTARLHAEQKKWLQNKWEEPFDGKTVVVTHMAPSFLSVPEEYKDDLITSAYASNLDDLVAQADVWIHGHMHTSLDYSIGKCRVVCNPRGYHLRTGRGENDNFDPNFTITI